MTDKELKAYFQKLIFLTKNKAKGKTIEELVDRAIVDGKDDFRGAYSWAFKEKHDTVTTTSAQETVELPEDFEGLMSVVQRTSTYGGKLRKYGADEYDRLMPRSTAHTNDTPYMYKVYFDGADDVWKLALYPTPNAAITLYLTYHIMGEIPDKYVGGLKAAVAKHLCWPGSDEWMKAENAFLMEIERLKGIDDPDVEGITRFLDSGDEIERGLI